MIDVLLWIGIIGLVVIGTAAVVVTFTNATGLALKWLRGRSPSIATPTVVENAPRLSTQQHNENYASYVVAALDTSFDPPRVCHVSCYSAGADGLTRADGNDCKVNLAVGYGDTYAEAAEQAEFQLRNYPWLKWAAAWLSESRGYLNPGSLCSECGGVLPKDPLVQEARKALMDPTERARLQTRIEELETQQRESDATKAYALGYQRGRAMRRRDP